jgi:monoterpene epsilon-lactone hydrolase
MRAQIKEISDSCNAKVLVPAYSLSPEEPFPLPLIDTISCYLKLLADGIKSDQIFVAGDSAGGNLAISLVLWLREHPEHNMLLGLFVVSPWIGIFDYS